MSSVGVIGNRLKAIALASDQSQAEPTITQSLGAQTKTLEFLTREVESLRSQLQQMTQERNSAIDQLEAINQQNADFAAL